MENAQTPDKGKTAGTCDGDADREQVHFYPAENVLLYIVDGQVRLRSRAWASSASCWRNLDDAFYTGAFVIEGLVSYAMTRSSPRIPEGTPIRESRTTANKVEYQEPSGRWRPLAFDDMWVLTASDLRILHEALRGHTVGFPTTWFLDNFDSRVVRYHRKDAVTPGRSDGCILLRHSDRYAFIEAEVLRRGMSLVIHGRSVAEHIPTAPEAAFAPSSARTMSAQTWYEVLIVDQAGEPVPDVELRIEVDGGGQPSKTAADGRARLSDAARGQATVSFSDPSALLNLLDERWAKDDEKDWIVPPDDAQVLEVTRLAADWRRPVGLSAESTKILILEPPYWLRLYDEGGQVMSNLKCTVSAGQQRFEQTSDAQGWIELPVGDSCPESATVEWQEDGVSRSMVTRLQCHEGPCDDLARARLWNLGFQHDDGDDALLAFQNHQDIQVFDGKMPNEVADRVSSRWVERNG